MLRSMLRRPQVKAVAGTAGLNILTTLVGGLGGVILARSLGPAGRGDLVTAMQWPYIFGCMATIGTTVATAYWISRDPDSAPDVATSAAAAVLLTGCLVALVGVILTPSLGRGAATRDGMLLLFLVSPVFMVGFVWVSSLQALDIGRWNVARTVLPLVYFAALAVLLVVGRLTIMSASAAYAGGVVLQSTYAWRQTRRALGRPGTVRRVELRRLYGYGWKVALSSAPQVLNVRLDLLVLSVMSSVPSAQLGNYAVAASLSWLALPISVAFGSVAFPRIASSRAASTARIERISIQGAALTAGVIMAVLSAGASWLIPRVFGSGFDDAAFCLWLLAPGATCLAVNVVVGELLMGHGKPLYTSVCEGVAAGLTIVLLIVLIPRYGIRGAAVASSSAYAVATVLLLRALAKVRRMDTHAQPVAVG